MLFSQHKMILYIHIYVYTYIHHTYFYYRKPFEIVSLRLFLRTDHLSIFCPLELKTPSRKQFPTIFMVYVLVGHAGVATIKKYIRSSISTGSQIVQLFLWAQLLSFHWTLSLLNNFHFLSASELILYKRHGLYSFIKSYWVSSNDTFNQKSYLGLTTKWIFA